MELSRANNQRRVSRTQRLNIVIHPKEWSSYQSILVSRSEDASSGKAEIRAFDRIKPTSNSRWMSPVKIKQPGLTGLIIVQAKRKWRLRGFLFRQLSGLPRGHSKTWLICQGRGGKDTIINASSREKIVSWNACKVCWVCWNLAECKRGEIWGYH